MQTTCVPWTDQVITIYLNAICQMVKAFINGQIIPNRDMNKFISLEKLVREAYARWNDLEEIDEVLNDNVALLTQGETVEQFQNNNNHPAPVIAYDQNDIFGEKSMEGGNYVASHHNHNNAQIGSIRWSPPFVTSITIHESDYGARLRKQSPDYGDITPSTSGPVDDGVSRWL
ncbi:hypothetical protein P8452_46501 [Trifolium repens]|nr:hypothetical protein P8452_46501 [Trifolium repens]